MNGNTEQEGRPRIEIGSGPRSIRVLTRAVQDGVIPGLYVTEGRPVAVQEVSGSCATDAGDDDAPLPLSVTQVRPPLLAHLLAHHATVVAEETTRSGTTIEVEKTPGQTVLSAVLAGSQWPGLPPLRGLIGAPVLRRDGTLLQHPGYDPATGLYLASTVPLPDVPDHPTPDQVHHARRFLTADLLGDFPWVSDADKANYLALLATPILRPLNRALTPFAIIDATQPASGKTILTSCLGLLCGQRVLTWTDSEEELRKTITSVLADPAGVIVFDNVPEGESIDSAVLAQLLTSPLWSDRRLGSNSTVSLANDRVWFATGNNLRTGGDIASRTVWVRLDPDMPDPETRTGFAIPHLDTWILAPQNRATLLWHLLVLIVDWTRAGAHPDRAVPPMRQFTTWAQTVGGFLAHHDISGFLANVQASRALDDDDADWRAFLLAWTRALGPRHLTAAELRRTADPDRDIPDPWDGLFPTTPTGAPLSVKSLGRRLTGQIGRWRHDVVLRSATDPATNARTYWVEHT